jgi:hypothetical protein
MSNPANPRITPGIAPTKIRATAFDAAAAIAEAIARVGEPGIAYVYSTQVIGKDGELRLWYHATLANWQSKFDASALFLARFGDIEGVEFGDVRQIGRVEVYA